MRKSTAKKNARLSVGRAFRDTSEGFGCQVDTHIFKDYNAYNEEDFAQWLDRIEMMNLQSVRTQVFPEWYERELRVFEFETEEMRQLYRLLDVMEERGIKVDLSFYGCNTLFSSLDGKYKGSPLANTYRGNWIVAPKLHENGVPFDGYGEYAEAVFQLLKYLLEVKKYTCIYEYSIFPEPNCSFFNEDGVCVDDEFIEFYKVVDARMERGGIKGKILCSGPGDCANDPDRYTKYVYGLDGIVNKNTSSVYKFNNSSTNAEMRAYAKTLVGICAEVGHTWGVCECGSNLFIDPANQEDTDTFERAIFLGRLFCNFVSAGCTNMKYWVLNDVYYGDFVMNLGLWKLKGKEFNCSPKPQFFTWSLITALTEFGSEISPIFSDCPSVCAVAFKLPTGERTYFMVNSSDVPADVELFDRHLTGGLGLEIYTVEEGKLPSSAKVISGEGTCEFNGGTLKVTLPPNSFVAFSNRII